ncbi:helix-turn-helix domain-containing protein [Acidisoma cellulosilytica]|uniref:Helix-turn-helix domain-containing protein n=1 Tax=Acidisoma cellulosilyticum TaxID=2802395 RepID=A0A963Z702_9PROT|nr:helix-turn-helix domain-containing protein [Acidisoma cellulosilyticum]
MIHTIEPLAYTIPAAIKVSGVARTSLYRLMSEGRLVAVKNGRRTLIRADSLKQYLASLPVADFRSSKKITA